MNRITCAALFIFLFVPSAFADYQTGMEAYKKGDFSAAYSEFKALATSGDYKAQFYMGVMHQEGQGVEKDGVTALRWFRLSAEGALKNTEDHDRECQSALSLQQKTIEQLQETIRRIRVEAGGNTDIGPN